MYHRLFTLPSFELFGKSLGPFTLHTYGVLLAIAFIEIGRASCRERVYVLV